MQLRKLFKYILAASLLLPLTTMAATTVPWNINNLTDTFISPGLVNGNAKGLLVIASSTIALFNFNTATSTDYGSGGINLTNGCFSIAGVCLTGDATASSTLLSDNNTFSGTNTFLNAIIASITGNAGTATKLQTARTIGTVTGDATSAGSSFDGSANNTNALTLATVNSNVGSFTNANITVNGKGLITSASNGTVGSAYPFTPATNFGVAASATTTAIWAQNALFASSTTSFPTLAVSQSGTGPAAIFTGGNVAIGTTSPGTANNLAIGGAVGGGAWTRFCRDDVSFFCTYLTSNNGAFNFQNTGNSFFSWSNGGTYNANTGNISGTNTQAMVLRGNTLIVGTSTNNSISGGHLNIWGANGFNNYLSVTNADTGTGTFGDVFQITNTGHVGIGTSTPNGALSIVDSNVISSNNTAVLEVHARSSTPYTAAFFNDAFSNTTPLLQFLGLNSAIDGLTSGSMEIGNPQNQSLSFYTNGHPNQRLTISASGNVGVGSTTPGYTLGVNGSASFGSVVSSNRRLDIDSNGAVTSYYGDNSNRTIWTAVNQGIAAANNGNNITFLMSSTTANTLPGARIFVGAESSYLTDSAVDMQFQTALNGNLRNNLTLSGETANVGVGSSTPWGRLSVQGSDNLSTTPAVAVQSNNSFLFGVFDGGNVGIGTTTPGSILSIGTTNGINFSTATSTFSSTGGINLTSGCFAVAGVCVGSGSSGITALTGDGTASGPGSAALTLATVNSNIGTFNNVTVNGKGLVTAASNVAYDTFAWPFTPVSYGVSTSTTLGLLNGFLSTASSTVNANFFLPQLATSAGSFLAVNPFGQVIATTTPMGTNYWTLTGNNISNNNNSGNGFVGIGSTTPWGQLSVNSNGAVGPEFVVGSSTQTSFVVENNNNVGIGTTTPLGLFSILGSSINTLVASWWGMTQTTPLGTQTNTFTSSGTYTKPAGAISMTVTVIAGGGGGGSGLNACGGGGGGSSSFGSIVTAVGGGGGEGTFTGSKGLAGNTAGGNGGNAGGTNGQAGGGGGGAQVASTSVLVAQIGATVTVSVGTGGVGCTTLGGAGGTGLFSGAAGNTSVGGGGGGSTGAGSSNTGGTGGNIGGPTVTLGQNGVDGSNGGAPATGAGGNSGSGATPGNNFGAGGNGGSNGNAGSNGTPGEVVVVTTFASSNSIANILSVLNFTASDGTNSYSYPGFGIGTTSPQATFAVQSSSGAPATMISGFIGASKYLWEMLDRVGHLITGGPAPSCGTGCSSVVGDDRTMKVTTGSVVSSITVNFANTYTTTPICIVTNEGSTVAVGASTTPTTVVVTALTAVTSVRLGIICQNSANFTN